ncbi:MAG: hypothetical protein DRJ55_06050 [Thermoprotei archaeon]|nr:MAG: hypothetical protein DRJ55_06050 [Thermoprotei archaeon]
MNEFFDLLIIDLPADPAWTLTPENIPVILVLDESPSSRKIVEKMSKFSNYFVIFNKCRIGRNRWLRNTPTLIPYDKNIASLNPSNLVNIYLSSSSRVLRPLNSYIRNVSGVEVGGNDKWLWKRVF